MLPALSQSLRLKAGLNIPEVHVGKVVGFFFLMLKMVYYTLRFATDRLPEGIQLKYAAELGGLPSRN